MSSNPPSNPPTKRASLEAMDAPREGGRSATKSASAKLQPVKLTIAIVTLVAAAFVIYWFNFHESGGPNVQRADQPMTATAPGPAASTPTPATNTPTPSGGQATGAKSEPKPEPVGTTQLAPGVQ